MLTTSSPDQQRQLPLPIEHPDGMTEFPGLAKGSLRRGNFALAWLNFGKNVGMVRCLCLQKRS
jgi:hypothetical protein